MLTDHLYIHIPFCLKKCIYCDFLSVPFDPSLASKYTDSLCAELRMRSHNGKRLKTLYIGGGTPTVLPQEQLRTIIMTVKELFGWEEDAEITVEANPKTVDINGLRFLLSMGINRLSIGVQSFNDRELAILGRLHNAEDARKSILFAQEAGFRNISVDLMYRIPSQNINSWHRSLMEAAALSPQHISTYELTPEKNTPLWPLLNKGDLRMPEEEETLEMYAQTIDFLGKNGYVHYEISNFALPGKQCLHNLNYWTRGEYIGAGAAAHSFSKGVRSANEDDLMSYMSMLEQGVLPEKTREELTAEEAFEEFIFLGLRMTDGVDLQEAERLRPDILTHCESLAGEGFLDASEGRLKLTKKGMTVSNTVFAEIFGA